METLYKKIALKFLPFIILIACNYDPEKTIEIPVIDLESSINKMELVNLSQFSDNIRYVPLETGPDIYFQGIWDCLFSDSLILARDINKCILFNNNGRFKSRIGTNGRGPGEYYNLKCTDFGADSNIFIQGNMNLYEYRLDGSFVKQYNNIFRLNKNAYNDLNKWIVLGDSLFFGLKIKL